MLGFSFTSIFTNNNNTMTKTDQVPTEKNLGRSLAEMNLKYKSGTTIGSGGFGKVYSGFRRTDKHPIKGVQVPLEVAMHSKVHHLPGIVGLLDHYQADNGNHVLVLERPEPVQDLFDFITQRGALDEFIARVFLKQIVESVVACHEHGVVHRDIKDENILVDMHSERCYLIDFGSSEELKLDAYQGYDAGTKVYCPPEWVKSGTFHPDAGTVWSIGILLYDMLCGDIPFEDEEQILSGNLAWRNMGSKISDRAKDLIRKCLAYKPEQRITLCQLLGHPFLNGCKFDENFAYYFQSYCQRRSRSKMPASSSCPINVPPAQQVILPGGSSGFHSQTTYSPLSPALWTFDCTAPRNDSLDSHGSSPKLSMSNSSCEETTACS